MKHGTDSDMTNIPTAAYNKTQEQSCIFANKTDRGLEKVARAFRKSSASSDPDLVPQSLAQQQPELTEISGATMSLE